MVSKVTPSQVEEMVRLREKKRWPVSRIASKFGLTESAVNYRLLRNGVDPWDIDKHPRKIGNHKGQFTPADDARMLELAKTMSINMVSTTMGRAITSVRIRLMTLEVRAEKALEKAA